MLRRLALLAGIALAALAAGCASTSTVPADVSPDDPFVVVLGVAQDGGAPQAGCRKPCCAARWADASLRRHVSCLGIVDPVSKQRWMIDATPDFIEQLRMLDEIQPPTSSQPIDGILLTHAHIGHYTGLMHLGHEALGASDVPVYAMERMATFLSSDGPWDQLVRYVNIALTPLEADKPVQLNERIVVTPFRVPHREEYSEVVGFRIDGPNRSVVFIPDIDKWERWDRSIDSLIADVDVAYLDGTFYADGEIPHRAMEDIPHPFIVESMARFAELPAEQRARVRFIHLNHTNPALIPNSAAQRAIESAGFGVARERERAGL